MKYLTTIIVLLLSTTVHANVISNDFLSSGIGVKPSVMGSAYSAVAEDANALYYNPAGLSTVRVMNIISSYGSAMGMGEVSNTAIAYPVGEGTIAISMISNKFSGVKRTDALGNSNGSFTYGETAYTASLGLPVIGNNIFIGSTVKLITKSTGFDSISTTGFDAGILYRSEYISLGATLHNIGGTNMGNDHYSQSIRTGIAVRPNDTMLLSVDYYDDSFKYGSQLRITEDIMLFGGYEFSWYSVGIGVNVSGITFNTGVKFHDLGQSVSLEIVL